MPPARSTVFAIAANIAMKVPLVWGLGFGLGGIAFGTAFGAWVNVAALITIGRMRGLLMFDAGFWRALPPTLLAAAVTAGGALLGRYAGQGLPLRAGSLHDLATLGLATALGICFYLVIAYAFRGRLPLGRFARKAIEAA